MKKNRFFGLLMAAMALFAVSFMTSCTEDDAEDTGSPSLSLSTSKLVFDSDGNPADDYAGQVAISSNRSWLVSVPTTADWVTVDQLEGSNNGTLTFSLPETSAAREATVSVKLYNDSGYLMEETISVVQYGVDGDTGADVGEVIFYEPIGGSLVAETTYVDEYTDWASEGTGASTVTFYGSGTSVRNSGLESSGHYTGASGVNNLFFGSAPAVFTVQNITLTEAQKNLKLTFGGTRYIYETSDNTFVTSSLVVSISGDGEIWSDVDYSFESGESWGFATANFTLAEASSSLYIRYTASESSVIRIDDVTLSTGVGGTVIDLSVSSEGDGSTDEPADTVETTMAVASLASNAGNSYKVTGTVMGVTSYSFYAVDETGGILVYGSVPTVSAGDVVEIEGVTSSYAGMGQFTSTATVTKTGSVDLVYPTPTVMSGSDLDAYLTDVKGIYVKYTGTLSVSGNYTNITFDDASTASGSISNAPDGLYDSSLLDTKVDVYGYLTGAVSSKYVQTVAVCIVAEGGDFILPEVGEDDGEVEDDTTELPQYDYTGTIMAADFGVETTVAVPDAIFGVYKFDWEKGGHSSSVPTYYTSTTSDNTIRMYALAESDGNTLTISTTDGSMLTAVDFVLSSGYSNLSANVGTYESTTTSGSWTGSAESVVFTTSSSTTSSAQTRIISITINGEYGEGGDGEDNEEDDVVEAVVGTAADLANQEDGTLFTLKDVYVDYISGSYVYVSYEGVTALIYQSGFTATVGQTITVTGTVGSYNGAKQLASVTVDSAVDGGTPVSPIVLTTADYAANYTSYTNQYICFEKVAISGTSLGDSVVYYNRYSLTDLPTSDIYTVYGYANSYNSTIQIYPTEFVFIESSAVEIPSGSAADLASQEDGIQFTLEDVYVDYISGSYVYVSSEGATALIYQSGFTATVGQTITVTGTVGSYNGAKQLSSVTVDSAVDGGTPVEPIVLTTAAYAADYATYANQYICFENVTISGTSLGDTVIYYNKYSLSDVPTADVYTVYGYGNSYNSVPQIYPTEFVFVEAGAVEPDADGDDATAIIADGNITIDEAVAYFDIADSVATASSGYDLDGLVYKEGDYTVTFSKGTSSYMRIWNASGVLEFRFYSGNIVTLEAASEITSVDMGGLTSGFTLDEENSTSTKKVYNFSATTKPKYITISVE